MKLLVLYSLLCTVMLAGQEKEKKGTVSFKKDVMTVFSKKCLNCHNTEDESPSRLYLDSYQELMKGDSKNGPVVKPKKGEESVLIMKLRGTAKFGKQMPRGKKPLDEETIELISTWIDQGAKNN